MGMRYKKDETFSSALEQASITTAAPNWGGLQSGVGAAGANSAPVCGHVTAERFEESFNSLGQQQADQASAIAQLTSAVSEVSAQLRILAASSLPPPVSLPGLDDAANPATASGDSELRERTSSSHN